MAFVSGKLVYMKVSVVLTIAWNWEFCVFLCLASFWVGCCVQKKLVYQNDELRNEAKQSICTGLQKSAWQVCNKCGERCGSASCSIHDALLYGSAEWSTHGTSFILLFFVHFKFFDFSLYFRSRDTTRNRSCLHKQARLLLVGLVTHTCTMYQYALYFVRTHAVRYHMGTINKNSTAYL